MNEVDSKTFTGKHSDGFWLVNSARRKQKTTKFSPVLLVCSILPYATMFNSQGILALIQSFRVRGVGVIGDHKREAAMNCAVCEQLDYKNGYNSLSWGTWAM